MNERKWKQLFAAARNEPVPAPSEAFEMNVLRAIHREGQAASLETPSFFDQLNLLFPRLAWAAAAIIAFSVAADWALTVTGLPGVGAGLAQISAQWLITPDGF